MKTATKRAIQKTAEKTGDLIGNKIIRRHIIKSYDDKITKAETVEIETENTVFDKEIPKETYISLEKRQKIIDDLKLIQ